MILLHLFDNWSSPIFFSWSYNIEFANITSYDRSGLESRVNNLEANFAGYRNGGELSGGVPIGGSYRNAANSGPMGDGYRNGANGGPTGDGYRNGGFGDGLRHQGILSFCDL